MLQIGFDYKKSGKMISKMEINIEERRKIK